MNLALETTCTINKRVATQKTAYLLYLLMIIFVVFLQHIIKNNVFIGLS